jgi:hypothetical protein
MNKDKYIKLLPYITLIALLALSILLWQSSHNTEAYVDQFTAKIILAAGLLISFLIFFYLKTLQATGERAYIIAQEMTSTLSESERKYRFFS